jgi:hypothetical protein
MTDERCANCPIFAKDPQSIVKVPGSCSYSLQSFLYSSCLGREAESELCIESSSCTLPLQLLYFVLAKEHRYISTVSVLIGVYVKFSIAAVQTWVKVDNQLNLLCNRLIADLSDSTYRG